jgi:C_GCAxxG_C_C family probable redox protein
MAKNNVDRRRLAHDAFAANYNCAQAMLMAVGPELGLDCDTCLKLASTFGGGMGRQGEVCGAVTGALMALGLRYGGATIKNPNAKAEVYAKVKQFTDAFKARHGSIVCRDILGCDISTPDGWAEAQARNFHTEICPKFVDDAISILDEMM